MERAKHATGTSYQALCRTVDVPYGNLMRWRERLGRGDPAVNRPGPRKVQPFDLAKLTKEILVLNHRQSRSAGSGELFHRYQDRISRRDFRKLVRNVRDEAKRARRAMKRRVEWNAPALIWSADETKLGRNDQGEDVMMNNVRDLASRHVMAPLLGAGLSGHDVAGHLDSLFVQHGAPLILKRDNGSRLNSREVDQVLEKYFVIPLNSPPHYPPYNGGIEQAQNEMKRGLAGVEKKTNEDRAAYGALRAHELNHMKRRSLNGAIACSVFSAGKDRLKEYSIKKRKEIFEEIKVMARAASQALRNTRRWTSDTTLASAAWRRSVETWLQNNGMITVSQPRKVLPHSNDVSDS